MYMNIGSYKQQKKGYKAFVLNPFPPKGDFDFSPRIIQKASQATLLLGKLDGITHLLPDVDFFLYMYVRKDAASSSQIEGTKATMVNAIEAELKLSSKLPPDVDDILHYVDAVNYGIKRLGNFPFSLRFIRELHKVLMTRARITQYADPGEFRNSQNWIGGTSPSNAHFIPPAVEDMKSALNDLEKFLHADDSTMPLIKAGVIHSQFETIHPFLDGNGRTGRLLITMYLLQKNILEKPVLFLSSYFKKHQKVYYDRLDGYHDGKVEKWLDFFLDGVIETADSAIATAKALTELREEDMRKIQSMGKTAAESAVKVLPQLFKDPIVNVALVQKWTGFTRQGAQKVIDRFVDLGILQIKDEDVTYGRSYIYKKYVDVFKD